SLNIVSLDSNTYYQVEPRDAGAPVYLNIIDGEPLADGDRRYAVFLARYFLNDTTSPVKSIERVTKFSADYQKVNRLLPAWRVNFERP
ncbi:hypothetical protein OFC47_26750, partial [Escherichia coli]|nr:hypothetical protein [Escherichia coli]